MDNLLLVLLIPTVMCLDQASNPCENVGETVVPHPDPQKYYRCTHGNPTEGSCPGGTFFNATVAACVPSPTDDRTILIHKVPSPKPKCGLIHCGLEDHWKNSDPMNCSYYYLCDYGTLRRMKCPGGEHFNNTQGECEPQGIAGCSQDTETTLPYTVVTAAPVQLISLSYLQCEGDRQEPDYTDCSYYYKCIGRTMKRLKCPNDQYFSLKYLVCKPKEEVNCKSRSMNTSEPPMPKDEPPISIYEPSTQTIYKLSTPASPEPYTLNTSEPPPPTTDDPPSPTTDEPHTQTTHKPSTWTTDEPLTLTTNEPLTLTTNVPFTLNTDEPLTLTTDKPLPLTTNKPLTLTTNVPLILNTDEPLTPTTDKPFTLSPLTLTTNEPLTPTKLTPIYPSTQEQFISNRLELPTQDKHDLPPNTNELLTLNTDEPLRLTTDQPFTLSPLTPTIKEPLTPTRDETHTPTTDKPLKSTTDEPITPTKGEQVTPTTDKPVTSTTYNPLTPTTEEPLTSTTGEPVTPTTNEPVTPTTNEPVTPTTDKPVTSTTYKPLTPTTEEPFTSTTDKPVTSTTYNPLTPTTDKPLTSTTDRPVTPTTGEPVTPTTDEPVTSTTYNPLTPTTEEPLTLTTGEPVTPTTNEPVTPTTDEPVTSTTYKPLTPTTEEPLTSTTDEPVTLTTYNPLTPTTEEPLTPTTDEPVTSTPYNPLTPTTEEPLTLTTDEPVTPTTNEPVTPTTDEPVTSTTYKPLTPTTEVPLTSTTDEPDTSTTYNPLTPTTEEPLTLTTDEPVTSTFDEPLKELPILYVLPTQTDPSDPFPYVIPLSPRTITSPATVFSSFQTTTFSPITSTFKPLTWSPSTNSFSTTSSDSPKTTNSSSLTSLSSFITAFPIPTKSDTIITTTSPDSKPFSLSTTTESTAQVPFFLPLPSCGGINWRLPDPNNCRSYYECFGGLILHLQCSEFQGFSPFDLECQPIEKASCISSSATVPETSTQVPIITTDEPPNTYEPHISTTTEPSVTTSPTSHIYDLPISKSHEPSMTIPPQLTTLELRRSDIYEPPVSTTPEPPATTISLLTCGAIEWLTPDPLDCSYYYQCAGGYFLHQSCPGYYEFSPTNLECQPREKADCISSTATVTETSTQVPTLKTDEPLNEPSKSTTLELCVTTSPPLYAHESASDIYKPPISKSHEPSMTIPPALTIYFYYYLQECQPKEEANCKSRTISFPMTTIPSIFTAPTMTSDLIGIKPILIPEQSKTRYNLPIPFKWSELIKYFYNPPLTTYEPPLTTYEPPVTRYEPPITSYEPTMTTTEPPIITSEPPMTTYEPPMTSYEPPVTTYPSFMYQCGIEEWLAPDPGDCSSFYQCIDKQILHITCPADYLFNSLDLECQPPYEVNCRSTLDTVTAKAEIITTNEPVTTHEPITPIYEPLIPYTDEPHILTTTEPPIVNPSLIAAFPIPSFAINSDHLTISPIPLTSPNPLTSLTSTTPSIITTPNPFTSTSTPLTSPNTPIFTETLPIHKPDCLVNLQCEIKDAWIVPDISDCEFYYLCIRGQISHIKCPYNFDFSLEKKECLPKSMAHCKIKSNFNLTTIMPTISSNTIAPTVPINCVNSTAKPLYFIVNDNDCRHYYMCALGIGTWESCPEGYEFSPKYLACLPSDEAQCGSLCSSNDVRFVADPHDVTRYYICFEGKPLPQKCPAGFHFDNTIQMCQAKPKPCEE